MSTTDEQDAKETSAHWYDGELEQIGGVSRWSVGGTRAVPPISETTGLQEVDFRVSKPCGRLA